MNWSAGVITGIIMLAFLIPVNISLYKQFRNSKENKSHNSD